MTIRLGTVCHLASIDPSFGLYGLEINGFPSRERLMPDHLPPVVP